MTDATGRAGPATSRAQRRPTEEQAAPLRLEQFPAGCRADRKAQSQGGPGDGFAVLRPGRYDDELILDELRRVAALVADNPLTLARFDALARVSYSLVHQRFGGWRQALDRAGLGHRYSGRKVTAKQRAGLARRMSNAALLEELRRLARLKHDAPLTVRDVDRSPCMSRSVLVLRFGSWAAALQRAGLRQSQLGRRFTGQQCFENLAMMWARLGRPPTIDEMRRRPSRIGPRAYVQRFGGWRATLEAFVRRMQAARGDPQAQKAVRAEWDPPRRRRDRALAEAQVQPLPSKRRTHPPAPRRGEDRPSGGMRFKVFQRDRFRCVACGNSPATDPACKLHVDHIEPFSKGGRTTLDNLRTLCAACNWSRGDGSSD
jgi:hypothetical protein